MKSIILLFIFLTTLSAESSFGQKASKLSDLKIVIIRHGEKPSDGDNLSCQGLNRASQLSSVLYKKIGIPDLTFVPTIACDKKTSHVRMFQTITPFAIKYNLTLNSKYDEKDSVGIASHIMKKSGTVLLVWEHSAISGIAKSLGIPSPPIWNSQDFDSIWIITYKQNGQAFLQIDKEGITPSNNCP